MKIFKKVRGNSSHEAHAGKVSARRSAFTLIELLVSVAIIAILVALFFSGLGMVKKKMEATKCLSNLRQIGLALTAYTGEFGGKLPARYADPAREPKVDDYGLYWPLRLLNLKYITNPDVFYCPSYFPRNNKEADKPVSSGAAQTYGMRDWVLPVTPTPANGGIRNHKSILAIKNPSDFFLVADSYWSAWKSQGYGIGGTDNRIHARHDGKANTLFADGHVKPMSADYFLTLNDPDHQPMPQYEYSSGGITAKFAVEEDPNPPR